MKVFDKDGFWGMSAIGWLWYQLQGYLDTEDDLDLLDEWLEAPDEVFPRY